MRLWCRPRQFFITRRRETTCCWRGARARGDSKTHQKKVQIGIRNKESAQIVGGINAGDPVITSGGYALPDGTQIKIEAPEKAESASSADEGKDKKDPADEKDPKDEKGAKKDERAGGKADVKAAKSGKGKE